jgi:hypothetical protein
MANVIGKDKLTLEGRIEYTNSVLDVIHKCAKDPYKNLEWLETENPWQSLATMIELSNALNVIKSFDYRVKTLKNMKPIYMYMLMVVVMVFSITQRYLEIREVAMK